MQPYAWWAMYGAALPKLQAIAMEVLSHSATASSCEQNWSKFQQVHSSARNRLNTRRADKLVWLFSNLRLVKRMQAMDQEQQAQAR